MTEPATEDDDVHSAPSHSDSQRLRQIARLGSAVREAASAERAQAVFGTKLIAGGLALVALAGGLDYFQHADDIYKALGGLAVDAGQGDLVTAVQGVNEEVDAFKIEALASLPPALRDHLAGAALALGAVLMGLGIRIKLRFARGRLVRDIGRAVAGPGFVGILAFAIISWRGVPVLRATTVGFTSKLRAGTLKASDLWGFTVHYAPWAWAKVGAVLVLGLVLVAAAVAVRLLWHRFVKTADLLGEIVFRTSLWGGLLSLGFYFAATLVAIVSYGGALRVVSWPWQTNRGAFVVTLAFMALGVGMARTGSHMMKREEAEADEAEPEPAPA